MARSLMLREMDMYGTPAPGKLCWGYRFVGAALQQQMRAQKSKTGDDIRGERCLRLVLFPPLQLQG